MFFSGVLSSRSLRWIFLPDIISFSGLAQMFALDSFVLLTFGSTLHWLCFIRFCFISTVLVTNARCCTRRILQLEMQDSGGKKKKRKNRSNPKNNETIKTKKFNKGESFKLSNLWGTWGFLGQLLLFYLIPLTQLFIFWASLQKRIRGKGGRELGFEPWNRL